jgi:hypothetical protein
MMSKREITNDLPKFSYISGVKYGAPNLYNRDPILVVAFSVSSLKSKYILTKYKIHPDSLSS